MKTRTLQPVRSSPNGSSTNGVKPTARASARTGARTEAGIGRPLSAAIAALMVIASAGGLWIDGLYQDPAWASAAFHGGDLVTLVVAAPMLAATLLPSLRGSERAEVLRIGLLAYSAYNYAFYVFGGAFNDFFLIHVALLSMSIGAFGLALAGLDVAGIRARFRVRTPARLISAFLLLVAAMLAGMWGFFSLRYAATGVLPEGAYPASGLHVIFALDLTLLVPSFAVAGVLLWRQATWGYLLGLALSVFGAVYQLNLLSATFFQARAGVPRAPAFDPLAMVLVLGFLFAAGWLFGVLRHVLRGR